jgi:hypothetical protein
VAIEIKLSVSDSSITNLLSATLSDSVHVIVLTDRVPDGLYRDPTRIGSLVGERRCFVTEPDVELLLWQLRSLANPAVSAQAPSTYNRYVELKRK